jgi:hypothetical protein
MEETKWLKPSDTCHDKPPKMLQGFRVAIDGKGRRNQWSARSGALKGRRETGHCGRSDQGIQAARATFSCARASLGALPVQRLNACVNALPSW